MRELALVDVVLFEGTGPGATHPDWSSLDTVNVIVWFGGNRRCRPPSASTPADSYWSIEHTALHHGAWGGGDDVVRYPRDSG